MISGELQESALEHGTESQNAEDPLTWLGEVGGEAIEIKFVHKNMNSNMKEVYKAILLLKTNVSRKFRNSDKVKKLNAGYFQGA